MVFAMPRLLLITFASVLLGAVAADAVLRTGSRSASAGSVCPAYAPGHVLAGASCVSVPWLALEVGPDARSILVTLMPGCFPDSPRAVARETTSTISIQVTAAPPAPGPATCIDEPVVSLRAPIEGRRIEAGAWPQRLRYGSMAGDVLGVPRLLGLAPADARRILWLQGLRAHVVGHGRQVAAQVPGWGLTAPDGVRPDPYSGSVTLITGRTIERPDTPALKAGEPGGVLEGALVFSGGPYLPGQRSLISGIIDVFNADGELIAQPHTHAGRYFRLNLPPGAYLLNDEQEIWVSCRATHATVQAGQITRVTIGVGCDIP